MHPAHTLHTLRGRVEPWDTPARSISTASFLCQRLWMSTCFANNRDLHCFWQHDVLDNMIFSFEFNMFSFCLFHQSNILLDNSSDHRWECQHGSWQQWTFQPKPFCFNSVWPSTSFLPTNKNYGSQHHGNTTNSCQVNSSRWVPHPLWRHRNNRASWNQLQMVEWFQQELETRDYQQGQRWCCVHGNVLHLGGVQQPRQQGDWKSTTNNCWWGCQGILPHFLQQQHPWCLLFVDIPFVRTPYGNKPPNTLDFADDPNGNINHWEPDYEHESQHIQSCWLSSSVSTIRTTRPVQQRSLQQFVFSSAAPASTNRWTTTPGSTATCGLFNSPLTWSTSAQRTHHWLGHFSNVSIWRFDHVSQHGTNYVFEIGEICRQQLHCNCINLKTGVKDEDQLRGSNNLVKYILANSKMVIQQQRAKQQELETARLASLAETTKENEIEGDDNMERPTNRQRLMWNINTWSQQRINRVR